MIEDNIEYPTEEELNRIKEWNPMDFVELMKYIDKLWWAWGYRVKDNQYHLSTGGWSGNERIIEALRENSIAWSLHWVSSHRGGHYVFDR